MTKENEMLRDEIKRRSGVETRKCMQCGKCSGTCPAYDEMEYHPNQFVYMVENGDIDKLLASKSIYKCLTCFACYHHCPNHAIDFWHFTRKKGQYFFSHNKQSTLFR